MQDAQFKEGESMSHLEEGESAEEKDQAKARPMIVTNIVKPFSEEGKKASNVGETIIQFKRLPPVMAPKPRRNIGISILKESDSNWDKGEEARGAQVTLIINRVEYLAVRPVAIKKINRKIKFIGE